MVVSISPDAAESIGLAEVLTALLLASFGAVADRSATSVTRTVPDVALLRLIVTLIVPVWVIGLLIQIPT